MLKIIDLKTSNIASVIKALKYIKVKYEVVDSYEQLKGADKILLPGVGSYTNASVRLHETNLSDAIIELVKEKNVPILGICIGMQLLAEFGLEGGGSEGLGLLSGRIKPLLVDDKTITVPHLGWNSVDSCTKNLELFKKVPDDSCFYFAHSFEFEVSDPGANNATTHHGKPVTAYVEKNNIYGAQFHPEKSQAVGLQFLRNFSEIC